MDLFSRRPPASLPVRHAEPDEAPAGHGGKPEPATHTHTHTHTHDTTTYTHTTHTHSLTHSTHTHARTRTRTRTRTHTTHKHHTHCTLHTHTRTHARRVLEAAQHRPVHAALVQHGDRAVPVLLRHLANGRHLVVDKVVDVPAARHKATTHASSFCLGTKKAYTASTSTAPPRRVA